MIQDWSKLPGDRGRSTRYGGFQLKVDVVGDLRETMRAAAQAGAEAVTRAVHGATDGLKKDWRRQIAAANLGSTSRARGLGNTIRSAVYPAGRMSLNAGGLVWTKAPHIIGAFERGVTIRADSRDYLAIPTPEAGRFEAGNRRITPAGWERRTRMQLRRILLPDGRALLVVDDVKLNRSGLAVRDRTKKKKLARTMVMFILVPQVRLRKRLDLLAAGDRALAGIPQAIVDGWKDT